MSPINNITVLGGGGQGFCDNITKALVIKCLTIGGGGSKMVHNCVTSFMDDPNYQDLKCEPDGDPR